jgi:glutathione S-transferase
MAGKEFLCGTRFTLADMLLYCWIDFANQVGQPWMPPTATSPPGSRVSASGLRARASRAPE